MTDRTTHDALLATILESPHDDAPRLVLTDLLDESGDADRAAFIRIQCEIARMPACSTPSVGASSTSHPNGLPCYECRPRDKPNCLPWCVNCVKRDLLLRRERELKRQLHVFLLPKISDQWFDHTWSMGKDEPLRFGYRTAGSQQTCEVEFRRGFVESVSLTTTAFQGGECASCDGVGDDGGRAEQYTVCPRCAGTGRVAGIAASLFRAQPVLAVRLTDREPREDDGGWFWRESERLAYPDSIPTILCDHDPVGMRRLYPSADAAHAALSAACVLYGRRAAKLTEEP